MRIIEFNDGFDSLNQPNQGSVECTRFSPFANDAAFETNKGSPGAAGDGYFNTTTQRVKYHDGTIWVTMSLPGLGVHGATHIQGAADEVDGDRLDIDFSPLNYVPNFTGTPATTNSQLAAHLKGIDASLIGGLVNHAPGHISGGGDQIDGDRLDIDYVPTNYVRDTTPVEVTLVEELTSHLAGIDNTLGSVAAHASTHISAGGDEIDGDRLDIDYVPANYTRDTTPAEVTLVEELTAHLAGIDNALIVVGTHASTHESGAADEIDGDVIDIDFTPASYTPTIIAPATTVDQLTSHLNGIDLKLAQGGISTFAEASAIVDFATTSATPILITSMTHTVVNPGNYLVFFNSSAYASTNNADIVFFVRKNTVAEANSQRDFLFDGASLTRRNTTIVHYMAGLVASDVIDVTTQASAGTITVQERTLVVMRVS